MRTMAVYCLSRTGHNSIINWIHANSEHAIKITDLNDQVISTYTHAEEHVVILRNPYNWFASWIVAARKWMSAQHIENLTSQHLTAWKVLARNYLKQESILPDNTIYILFDKWYCDASYRNKIAKMLQINTDDHKAFDIAIEGGGSTWDGLRYDGKTYEMDVLNRWKRLTDDAQYKASMLDAEIIDLTRKIFGVECPIK